MRKITFDDFRNQNKEELQIYILENEFECILNKCDFNRINIEQYLKAISSDNLKLLVFKFYLPKKRTKCLQIFYSEEKNGYFESIKKSWQYKIMSKNEEALLEEDTLANDFCKILNNEKQSIRNNIRDFFIALGCNSNRVRLTRVQRTFNFDENSKNKEVRISEN